MKKLNVINRPNIIATAFLSLLAHTGAQANIIDNDCHNPSQDLYSGELLSTGNAKDIDQGYTLYCEIHSITASNQIDVIYYIGDKILATKTLTVDDDLSKPNFVQTDASGKIISSQRKNQEVQLSMQASDEPSPKSKRVNFHDVDVIDAGFDPWIRQNGPWQENQSRKLTFALPTIQKLVKMRIKRKASCSDQMQCFEINIANPLLRWLVTPIKLTYDQQQQLLTYQGITNITNDDGKAFRAHIDYRHYNNSFLAQADQL